MRKTGSKRGSGYDSGLLSAALAAPEESCASEVNTLEHGSTNRGLRDGARDSATRPSEQRAERPTRRSPAPVGAYQRGLEEGDYDALDADAEGSASAYGARDEEAYVPRRGRLTVRFRSLPRSTGGRIVFASVLFVLLGGVAMAMVEAHSYLMHDSRFVLTTSDDVQIWGAEHLSRDQVLNVFGPDLERSIFRVPLAERRNALEQIPWVAHATVMRLLPNVLRVKIVERTPVAFVRQGTQVELVDSNGVLLNMSAEAAGDPRYSFPVVTGVTPQETPEGRAERMQVYLEFMKALDSTGQHLTESVSEVDISDPEDLRALITSGGSDILVHFGQQEFLKRYEEFEQHLPEWKQTYPRLASADMRYEGQIVLGMQGDGGSSAGGVAPEATAGAAPTAVGPEGLPQIQEVKKTTGRPLRRQPSKARVARKRTGSGMDAANERVFAQLSQARRAALSRQTRTLTEKAVTANRQGSTGSSAKAGATE
ncbi:MAG: cell division protein FtsQ/DivIB [Acidobacteriaceae bacterium]